MAGIAGGRWVVTQMFVTDSFARKEWQNERDYVVSDAVLHHRKNWARLGEKGAPFYTMKAVLLLKNEQMSAALCNIKKIDVNNM